MISMKAPLVFRQIFVVLTAAASLFVAAHAEEGSEPRPVQVMVLGTYHFGNPGLDLNNVVADDVLSGRRQKELHELSLSLSAFKPTVIAVERQADAPFDDPKWPGRDLNDLRPLLETNRNEIVQIGYRTAYNAGSHKVIAIDEQTSEGEPTYFPFGPVQELAEELGETDALNAIADASPLMEGIKTAEAQSIPAALLYLNTETAFDSFYWDVIRFGKGEDQPGAELASYWFMRNAKIFNKLQQATEPGDRVLVVYGAGHLAWLKVLIDKANGYELINPVPYLEQAIRNFSE